MFDIRKLWLLPFFIFFFSFHSAMSRANKANTDLIVFSYDRPLQLYALLESLESYVTGLAQISVIYRVSRDAFF